MKRVYDIFISFKNSDKKQKTKDRALGIALCDYLESKGLQPFFSATTIEKHGIDKWDDAIDEALKSAKVFVAIGSTKAYMTSPWVQKERTIYLTLKSLDSSKALFVYILPPMTLQDLPSELSGFQCFQDRESHKFERLYNSIVNHLKENGTNTPNPSNGSGGVNQNHSGSGDNVAGDKIVTTIHGDINGIAHVSDGHVEQTFNIKKS